jgi:hypothetical protein
LTGRFNDAREPGSIFAVLLERTAGAIVIIAGYINIVVEAIRRMTDALNDFAKSTGLKALNDFIGRFGDTEIGTSLLPGDNLLTMARLATEGLTRNFQAYDMLNEPGGMGFIERNLEYEYDFGYQLRGGDINITVTSADPDAVIDALKRYSRYNGPITQFGVPIG